MDYVRGLHFIGKLDRKEEAYILSKQQEEAVGQSQPATCKIFVRA